MKYWGTVRYAIAVANFPLDNCIKIVTKLNASGPDKSEHLALALNSCICG